MTYYLFETNHSKILWAVDPELKTRLVVHETGTQVKIEHDPLQDDVSWKSGLKITQAVFIKLCRTSLDLLVENNKKIGIEIKVTVKK